MGNTLQTSSENNKEIARKYFDFRLLQESVIQSVKNEHKLIKKSLIKMIKSCKNVSLRRIDNAISIHKKYPIKNNDTVFDFIISDLNGVSLQNYLDNKHIVQMYIDGIFKINDEMKEAIKLKKREFNKFKRSINVDLTLLNKYYLEFKSEILTYKKLGMLEDGYKEFIIENKFIEDVKNEYVCLEIKKIDESIVEKMRLKREKERLDQIHIEALTSMFNIEEKPVSDEMKMVLDVLSGLNIGEV